MSAFSVTELLPLPLTWQITIGILACTLLALAAVSLYGTAAKRRTRVPDGEKLAVRSARLHRQRVLRFRVLACGTAALGISYIVWRYAASINTSALWFAIPLVAAETYSLIDALLFMFMMWKPHCAYPLRRSTTRRWTCLSRRTTSP
jgi:hypothetical protein